MLYLYFNWAECPYELDYLWEEWFDGNYEESWLFTDFAKKVMREIDQVTPLSFEAVESDILGVLSPTWLSGGVKTLLLLEQQRPYQSEASYLGDNCAPYLEELSERLDIHMHFDIPFQFTNTQKAIFPELNNQIIVGTEELLRARRKNYDYKWDYTWSAEDND